MSLTVVFDPVYYSDNRVAVIQNQGYDAVSRPKSDKYVYPQDVVWSQRVDAFALMLKYKPTTIPVHGREKTYQIASEIVEIDGVDPIR